MQGLYTAQLYVSDAKEWYTYTRIDPIIVPVIFLIKQNNASK